MWRLRHCNPAAHPRTGVPCQAGDFIHPRRAVRLRAVPAQERAIATKPKWTIRDSERLYNLPGWGLGFFRTNADGHLTVHPDASDPSRSLDLFRLAMDLNAQGVGLPLLLRFSDILRSRIEALSSNSSTCPCSSALPVSRKPTTASPPARYSSSKSLTFSASD